MPLLTTTDFTYGTDEVYMYRWHGKKLCIEKAFHIGLRRQEYPHGRCATVYISIEPNCVRGEVWTSQFLLQTKVHEHGDRVAAAGVVVACPQAKV